MMLYLPSGSPTGELFAESYNNTGKSYTISLGIRNNGFAENTRDGWLSVNDNHGIYNKSTSSNWWLASPGGSSYNELYVNGSGGYIRSWSADYESRSIRPLVCIPTSVFNSKYATDTTLVDQ